MRHYGMDPYSATIESLFQGEGTNHHSDEEDDESRSMDEIG